MKFSFFGTTKFSTGVLDILHSAGYIPTLIITTPDAPSGRGMRMTPSPVKLWADEHSIPCIQPAKLNDDAAKEITEYELDLSVVVAYGKILTERILNIPKHGSLNLHASLLPKLRGASPIETSILDDAPEAVGVTIIEMDASMDTGAIVDNQAVSVDSWPPRFAELEEKLMKVGGELLTSTIDRWVSGEILPKPQNDQEATYTRKLSKSDAMIDLADSAHKNLLKIRALGHMNPYFFYNCPDGKSIRVIVKDAEIQNGELKLKSVIPEGGKQMTMEQFSQKYGV